MCAGREQDFKQGEKTFIIEESEFEVTVKSGCGQLSQERINVIIILDNTLVKHYVGHR